MFAVSALLAVINAITFLLIVVIPQLAQSDNAIRLLGVWNLLVTFAYFSLAGGLATKQRASYNAGITLGFVNAMFMFVQANQAGQINNSALLLLIFLDLAMVGSIYLSKETLLATREEPRLLRPELPEQVGRAVTERVITEEEGSLLLKLRDGFAETKKAERDVVVNGVRIDIAWTYGVFDQKRTQYFSFVPLATPEIVKTLLVGGNLHYLVATDITDDAYSAIPNSCGGVYVLRRREKIIRSVTPNDFEQWLVGYLVISFTPIDTSVGRQATLETGGRKVFRGNIAHSLFILTGGGGALLGGIAFLLYGLRDQDIANKAFGLSCGSSLLVFTAVASLWVSQILRSRITITERGIDWISYWKFRRVAMRANWQEIKAVKNNGDQYLIEVEKEGDLREIRFDSKEIDNHVQMVTLILQRTGLKMEPFFQLW